MATYSSPESMWIKFFSEAGLPPGIGATYALTFTDNRIQMNMLLDLNKEYLRDMGITCLGDVIAILKHAKKFHDDTARDRVLSISGPKVPVAAVAGRPGVAKPTTPTTRMLEHYTRNPPVSSSPSNSMASVKERLGAIHITGTKRKVVTPGSHSSSPESNEGRMEVTIPTKHKRDNLKQQNVFEEYVANSTSDSKLPSVKKQISSSVFNRLGLNEESRISLSPNKSPPKVTITGLKKTITKSTSSNTNTVFSRLGGKGDSFRRDSSDSNEPLKYEGILKGSSPVKKIILNRTTSADTFKSAKKIGTMRADEEPISVRDKLPLSHQRKSVKFSSHIDYKEIENRATTNVPPHAPTVPPVRTVAMSKVTTVVPMIKKVIKRTPVTLSRKSSVKTRLGKSSLITKRSKSNVFGRLGITSKM